MKRNSLLRQRLLAVATAALLLGAATPARAEFGLDASISRHVNRDLGSGFMDDTMKLMSRAELPVLVPIGLAIGGGEQGRKTAALAAVAGVLAFADSQLLKLAIRRTRPYLADPSLRIKWKVETDSSFPSSHATVAFAVATIVSEQYHEDWITALSYSLAGIVGVSRIYMGQHYLTDVLAGAVLGYGTARGVLWLRDAVGLHDALGPAPAVSWLDDGTPALGISWGFGGR